MSVSLASRFRTPRVAKTFFRVSKLIHGLESICAPFIDIVIRLSLGQIFLVSALLKLSNWDNALHLSQYEYPLTWLDSSTAAVIGVTIELVGSLMFMAGLGTRLSAVALLALSIVIQFNYRALDAHLFWIALFAWYALLGAGSISLDRWISPGLKRSPVPLAAGTIALLKRITDAATPWVLLTFRAFLTLSLLAAAWQITRFDSYLPRTSATEYLSAVGVVLIAFTAIGFATRAMSIIHIFETLALLVMASMDIVHGYWVMLFALFATHGPGALAIDSVVSRFLKQRFPQLEGKPAFSLEGLPHVVIVGAGFGGLTCAQRLAESPVRITVIDRQNYHLFQPLLYQVATSALSSGDIAMPIRSVLRDQFNVRVLLGEVTEVNAKSREVYIGTRAVQYDYLVLATGAAHSYFGQDQWAAFAPGLKRIDDAVNIQRRILTAFERAEAATDDAERRAQLTFLIVGGGPTGVELAGAIAELARFGMRNEFRSVDPADARVVLIQAGPRLLPTFPEALSEITRRSLEDLGVEVRLNARAKAIDSDGVLIDQERIAAKTVLWAAGVVASPAAKWLHAAQDNAGRIKVNQDLSVPDLANVFAIGDTALSDAWDGAPVPGLAPAAKQGGEYVARALHAKVTGAAAPSPFRYRHLGSLATIGRKAAVADLWSFQLSGATAWWLWGLFHVTFLVGVRNRFSVMVDWIWSYLTFKSATRLITGTDVHSDNAAGVAHNETSMESSRARVMTTVANA